jgi:hypothetical protein
VWVSSWILLPSSVQGAEGDGSTERHTRSGVTGGGRTRIGLAAKDLTKIQILQTGESKPKPQELHATASGVKREINMHMRGAKAAERGTVAATILTARGRRAVARRAVKRVVSCGRVQPLQVLERVLDPRRATISTPQEMSFLSSNQFPASGNYVCQ